MLDVVNLTADELEEFNSVNCLAHTLARENAGETHVPAWLCMSDEAKNQARQVAADWFNEKKHPTFFMTVKNETDIERFEAALSPCFDSVIQQWIMGESGLKEERKTNPRAFFVPNANGE